MTREAAPAAPGPAHATLPSAEAARTGCGIGRRPPGPAAVPDRWRLGRDRRTHACL